ncbi:MAG: SRPBCC domain-containing protein [Gammaproteobacteria bacterium]|nr:MAG: SRPBCC domain-containing protein [Gammaproteobacteria bacterium]
MNNLACHVTQVIDAPLERVFDAWLNPEMLSRFMLPMPGMPEPKTEVDGRQGGRFTIHMEVGEEVIPHSGTYLEIDRPNRLVFSWESPFAADGSTVTLEFSAQDSDSTVLMLTHERFIDEESRNNHEAGWGCILKLLGEICR